MDGRDRRDAQVAQRRDEPAPGRVRERKVVDRGGEDVRDLLRDELLGRRHPDEDRLGEAADRGARLLAERGVRLVADDELVRVAAQFADVAREPGVGLDRDRIVVRRLLAALDRRDDSVAVALVAELAVELRDEQTAVREDQDADRARGLDEARGCDRLARRGRMAKAEAASRARIGVRGGAVLVRRLDLELFGDRVTVLLGLDLLELLGGDGAVAVRGLQKAFLVRRDQLGQHSRRARRSGGGEAPFRRPGGAGARSVRARGRASGRSASSTPRTGWVSPSSISLRAASSAIRRAVCGASTRRDPRLRA